MSVLIWSRLSQYVALAAAALMLFWIGVFGISAAMAQNDASAARKNEKSDYAALAEAPEKARARKNPLEGDPQAVKAGAKLFEEHCAECHGEKAGGTRHGVSLLREQVQSATPGTLFWVLTNGVVRRGMPVWSKLPEPERWQIVTFLQSLKLAPATSQSMRREQLREPANHGLVKADPVASVQHIP
ncbi:MAG: c-type cytochrome [Terriglobales bacterium]